MQYVTATHDDVFDALHHEHRRETVRYLVDADGPVDEAALYDRIAGRFDVGDEHSDPATHVAIQFHHCHRPKLEAAALAEFDDDGTVVAGDRAEAAAAAIDAVTR